MQVKSKGTVEFVSKDFERRMKTLGKEAKKFASKTGGEMLINLPTVLPAGFTVIDRIMVPAGRIGESISLMSNTMVSSSTALSHTQTACTLPTLFWCIALLTL